VTNIIKPANGSGAARNAMLKGQMLATALDVYFGGGPGGNPLDAGTAIGSVKIDLTLVNKPIGSAAFENTKSSFNNITPQNVQGLLNYAASRSNVAGTIWLTISKCQPRNCRPLCGRQSSASASFQ
jgi:hypothetical protein